MAAAAKAAPAHRCAIDSNTSSIARCETWGAVKAAAPPIFARRREMVLTATQIRYLLAAHRLQMGGTVRSAEVAGKLHVARPSVHRMILQLCDRGLLEKARYSTVRFTEKGYFLAERYAACYTGIHQILQGGLAVPDRSAEEGALAVLGSLSSPELTAVYGMFRSGCNEQCGFCYEQKVERTAETGL